MASVEKFGKYEVLERIGKGGMGTIFKARDPVLNRTVALKVISSAADVTDELRARFYREAQACARLSHPNIVTVYDLGEADGHLFIVMEYLEGQDLKRLIAARTPVALEDKLAIMRQVCEGLHYAHRHGVVHRDIKPSNILLTPSGQAKILDFGVARIADAGRELTRTGLIVGTLRYIAPEQVRGHGDARSDIFSVGAVFYEFLSGRPPFTERDPAKLLEQIWSENPAPLRETDPELSDEIAAIVDRAMQKEAQDRFGDLEQMRLAIESARRKLLEEGLRPEHARTLAEAQRRREATTLMVEDVPQTSAAEAPATTVLEPRRDRWTPGVEEAGPRWSWLRWARGVAVVAVVCATIAALVLYWPGRSVRVERPMPAGSASRPTAGSGPTLASENPPAMATAPAGEAIRAGAEPSAPARAGSGSQEGGAGGGNLPRGNDSEKSLGAPPVSRQSGSGQTPARAESERTALPPRSASVAGSDAGDATRRPAAVKTRRDADAARARLTPLKRSAEQAAAGYYAPRALTSARATELDGAKALEQSDYESATRLFDEARLNYQTAVEEARREAETERQLEPLKASLTQARAAAIARRQEALAAGADRLATEALERAQARHAEADVLTGAGNLAAAIRAYKDAADSYAAARTRAESTRGAK